MIWRRLGGALLMTVGGAAVVGMTAVASVVIANYVEWRNAADNLSTVAMIALPIMLAGVLVALLGRWLYGDWTGRAPLARVLPWPTRLLGIAIAAGLGLMLAMLIAGGLGPDNSDLAVALAIGLMGGVALTAIGFLIGRDARSNLWGLPAERAARDSRRAPACGHTLSALPPARR